MTDKLDKTHFRTELKRRAARDKTMRLNAMKGIPWDAGVDEDNTVWIKRIIKSYGWPKISEYGKSTLEKVWVLVQHADHDPEFQEHCLVLMKNLPSEEINLTDKAFLEDRVRINTGRKQLYGTQFYEVKGKFGPQPIEDETNLEARRSAMGLNSLREYTAIMMKLYRQNGK